MSWKIILRCIAVNIKAVFCHFDGTQNNIQIFQVNQVILDTRQWRNYLTNDRGSFQRLFNSGHLRKQSVFFTTKLFLIPKLWSLFVHVTIYVSILVKSCFSIVRLQCKIIKSQILQLLYIIVMRMKEANKCTIFILVRLLDVHMRQILITLIMEGYVCKKEKDKM